MAISVLIIEASQLIQKSLASFAFIDGDIEILGIALNIQQAQLRIQSHKPQVLILDAELLDANNLKIFEQLVKSYHIPVVIVSSSNKQSALQTLQALEHGAVDFVTKPSVYADEVLENFGTLLHEKIVVAITAGLKIKKSDPVPIVKTSVQPIPVTSNFRDVIIAIGASTGGSEALKEILMHLPADCPPVVVTQHMPSTFTSLFAKRLDELCATTVIESRGGELLLPGHVFIAPGGMHLSIRSHANGLETHIDYSEPVNRHRPSVDVLFNSVALHAGAKAIGVLLTGMGRDGADGLGAMRKAGAFTIAQDEGSSVVFGMPKAAIDAGYVSVIAPIEKIALQILQAAQ